MEHNSSYGYLTDCREVPITFPPQHQDRQPGFEYVMEPKPVSECGKVCRKLEGKAALITGGDSGIGRAVAYDFVKQGANVAIAYYDEDGDAEETAKRVQQLGGRCLLLRGDLKDPAFAKYCVDKTLACFGKLDILVNNHADTLLGIVAGGERNTGQRRSARSYMDAADPRVLLRRRSKDLRSQNQPGAHDAGGPALRSLALLCIPGIGRRQLYDRAGASSGRRNNRRFVRNKAETAFGTVSALLANHRREECFLRNPSDCQRN